MIELIGFKLGILLGGIAIIYFTINDKKKRLFSLFGLLFIVVALINRISGHHNHGPFSWTNALSSRSLTPDYLRILRTSSSTPSLGVLLALRLGFDSPTPSFYYEHDQQSRPHESAAVRYLHSRTLL